MTVLVLPVGDSQSVGNDQHVCVVEQGHLRPLHQQEESELDEQHQSQLPYAADVQEHRAGQQGQQYTVAEILQHRGNRDKGRRRKKRSRFRFRVISQDFTNVEKQT